LIQPRFMKLPLCMTLATGAAVALVLWIGSSGKFRSESPEASQSNPGHRPPEAGGLEPPKPAAGGGVAPTPTGVSLRGPAPETIQASAGTFERLLADRQPLIRMRHVPPLDQTTESFLVERYGQTQGVTNRFPILRLLAFRGGAASVPVLSNAITADFSGLHTTVLEGARLLYLPQLMGVLAQREDAALEFLLRGAQAGFWSGKQPWFRNGECEQLGKLMGACIKGLGLSGRPEADALLAFYWNHPEVAGLHGVDGAVVEAAFERDVVRELGIERAMDEVFYSPDYVITRFRQWCDTPKGEAWVRWSAAAEMAVGRVR